MIIWRGFGFLVAVIGVGALVLAELVSERITGDQRFYQQHGWVALIGMLVAAGMTYALHKLLTLEKARTLIDKETGQEIVLCPNHSLFFVPVQLWPVIFVVVGLVYAVTGPQSRARNAAADRNLAAAQKQLPSQDARRLVGAREN